MIVVGIDENGLGPRLGPLVVTAVSMRCDERGAIVARGRPGRAFGARLGDSKALVSHGDTALGEAWARAVHARTAADGDAPRTPAELVQALSVDAADVLRSRCPERVVPQCWGEDGEVFTADQTLRRGVARDLDRLAARGARVLRATVAVVCTERLNDAAAQGRSRFMVDLHTMERLVLHAHASATSGEELVALCGKVGGYDRYADAFGPLGGRLHVALAEGRALSAYRFPGLGEVAFVRDADARHLVVGMASLIGKWVRDLLTDRVVRHYRTDDAELPRASGYHDPVTARFVRATELLRRTRQVPDECFERRRVGAPS